MVAPHATTAPLFDDPPAVPGGSPARVRVLLPLPLAGAYDYLPPAGETVAPGDFVAAPLGSRLLPAVVWDDDGTAAGPEVAPAKLRRLAGRLDVPPLGPVGRRFVAWVAAYCCAASGAVLRMAMSVSAALEPPPVRLGWRLDGPPPDRLTPARSRVVALMSDGLARSAAEIAELAGCGTGVVSGLA
jgi:primosomal protein N' (replication factor Y) (superfamily II helicase)